MYNMLAVCTVSLTYRTTNKITTKNGCTTKVQSQQAAYFNK